MRKEPFSTFIIKKKNRKGILRIGFVSIIQEVVLNQKGAFHTTFDRPHSEYVLILQFHATVCLSTAHQLHKTALSEPTVWQEIFHSEKFRQKRPSGSSSGIYFRQTSVVARLLFGRSACEKN